MNYIRTINFSNATNLLQDNGIKDDHIIDINFEFIEYEDLKDYTYSQTGGIPVEYGKNTVIFPETMFLPQRLTREVITDRPKISIKLQGNETPIERYLYNDEILNSLSVWNQGKSITYVITIGNEEAVIDFAADVGGWEDGSPNIVPVQ